jgi:hypothetical protein
MAVSVALGMVDGQEYQLGLAAAGAFSAVGVHGLLLAFLGALLGPNPLLLEVVCGPLQALLVFLDPLGVGPPPILDCLIAAALALGLIALATSVSVIAGYRQYPIAPRALLGLFH